MLKCVSPYRNVALRIHALPGEFLAELSTEEEDFLLRDSPGSFERIDAKAKSDDRVTEAVHVQRERVARVSSERVPEGSTGEAMSSENMPGLVKPK